MSSRVPVREAYSDLSTTKLTRKRPPAMEGSSTASKCQNKQLKPAAEENPLERVELTIDDLVDVTEYLLDLNKFQIFDLGLVLGLSHPCLTNMEGSHSFRNDMIAAWLRREDQVSIKGVPTWDTLVKALRQPRMRQTGVANRIATDKGLDVDTLEGVTGGSKPAGSMDLKAAKRHVNAPQQQQMVQEMEVEVDNGGGRQEEQKQSLRSIDWDWDDEVLRVILALPEDEIYTEIMEMPTEKLESHDQGPYKWRIVNALAAVCRDDTKPEIVKKIRTIFVALKDLHLLWLAEKQDSDGDTCLHSACNSRNSKTLELLLEFFPNECKKALQTRNKKQQTPLQVALHKSDWNSFKLLLSFSIRHNICQELIGIRQDQHAKPCLIHEGGVRIGGKTTLMHEAMNKGFGVEYIKHSLQIIIDELGNKAAKSSLVNYDEACNSAWYYLVERGDYRATRLALDEVKQRLPGVKTTELYVNCMQQTVLHQACRDNFKETIEGLQEEDEKLVDAKDVRGILPRERLHTLRVDPHVKK